MEPSEHLRAESCSNFPGVDLMAAIRSATYWCAVMMRVDKEYDPSAKDADIIAVKGDVLRYIDLLQRVNPIIKHGRRYK